MAAVVVHVQLTIGDPDAQETYLSIQSLESLPAIAETTVISLLLDSGAQIQRQCRELEQKALEQLATMARQHQGEE